MNLFSTLKRKVSFQKILLILFLISIFIIIGVIAETISEFNFFSGANTVNVSIEENLSHLNISTAAPYNHLIGYWSFDGDNENSKLNKSYDLSEENITYNMYADAVVNSSTCLANYGNCLQLDGTGDYINAPDNPILNVNLSVDNVSISAWVYSRDIAGYEPIFVSDDRNGNYWGYLLSTVATGEVWLTYGDGTGVGAGNRRTKTGTTALQENKWYHLVGVIRNGTDMDIYINGADDGGTYSGTGGVSTYRAADGPSIGRLQFSSLDNEWNGTIDEVMIFNTSLTSAQVTAIYNNQSARFVTEGTQEIKQLNFSSGYDTVNITLDGYNRHFGSNISLRIGEWNVTEGYNETDFNNQGGLVSYWHFDESNWEGTIGEVKDSMGTNNGTGQNGTNITSSGRYHNAGNCSGADYINTSFSQSLNFTRENNPDKWAVFNNSNHVIAATAGTWDVSGATFASVMNETGEIKMWYHGWNTTSSYVGYANSSDGRNFTKPFTQPIFSPNFTNEKNYRVPNVWKEGDEYHMIYTYQNNDTGSWIYAVGHANSTNGINWTKDPVNPVYNSTQSNSAIGTLNFENCFGVLKNESMYYMWFSGWGEREIGLANSTNLSVFKNYQDAPIFDSSETNGDKRRRQYCPHPFKHKDYFYLLVPSYDETNDYGWLYLYRDTNPTFLAANRELVRVALIPNRNGTTTSTDHDLDTPWILTNISNIERNISDGELWTYYAAEKTSGGWGVSLSIEDNVTAAVEVKNTDWINSSELTLSSWVKFNSTSPTNSMIISKGNTSYFLGVLSNTGKFMFGDNTGYRYTDISYNDGEWHHVVGKHTGINLIDGLKIYVDGVEINTTSTSGVFHGFYNEQGDGLSMCAKFNGTANLLNGLIDEVMIFNRSLSGSEIKELYAKGRASWNYTDYQNLTAIDSNDNSSNNQFSISNSSTNLLPVFKLLAETNNFYSPILKATLNLTLTFQDTSNPIVSLSCSPTSVTAGDTITCTCSATDALDSNPTISYVANPPTSSAGTFTTTCNATDSTGNLDSSNVSYTVTSASSEENPENNGGSPGGAYSGYDNTFVHDSKEFSEVKEVTKSLAKKNRIRIKINNQKHHIGVKELTKTNATIEVSSTPQSMIFNISDENKFDVTEDGYYDIYVRLNSIEENKANLTIKSVYEEIPVEKKKSEKEKINDKKIKLWLRIFSLIFMAIVIVLLIRNKKTKRKKEKQKKKELDKQLKAKEESKAKIQEKKKNQKSNQKP